jgi:HEAT repeat protein
MRRQSIAELLNATRDPNPKVRKAATRDLCPCQIKVNDSDAWNRLVAMTADPESEVRWIALHAILDGSPRSRRAEVVRALESMYHDPNPRLRRQVRKVLGRHRATGKVNFDAH